MKLFLSNFLLFSLLFTFFTSCTNEREEDQIILLQKYITDKHNDIPALESGLFFVLKDTAQGDNLLKPQTGDSLYMSINGKLADNKTTFMSIDLLEPLVHVFKEEPAIEGWEEGLKLMHEGDSAILAIPPDLAYGKRREGQIPPYSGIIFEIRLIKIIRNQ